MSEHGSSTTIASRVATKLAAAGHDVDVPPADTVTDPSRCKVPDDVVFTVEYSVRTAWTAVATLLKLDRQLPPVYQGRHDPKVLIEALETLHRR
ncbi:MAG: oleate hydratase [Cryptosporangiaceae bacterium]|nr:oleate hydratase [Cryptosporangiaceae bacterium]